MKCFRCEDFSVESTFVIQKLIEKKECFSWKYFCDTQIKKEKKVENGREASLKEGTF